MKQKSRVVIAAVFIILLIYFIQRFVSAEWIVINDYPLNIEKASGEIRICVISDLHDHVFGDNNSRLVEMIQSCEPDMIIMAGDMINGDTDRVEQVYNLIKQVRGIAPVYYGVGNHEIDYMQKDCTLLQKIEKAGAVVLEQSYLDTEIRGQMIRIGGLYDYPFGIDDKASFAAEKIKIFLTDFAATENLKILIAHRPESFSLGDASEVYDIDLVISGHAHGGQVVVPVLGGLYGGDLGWFPEYVHGMFEINKIHLFVTSGLGSGHKKLPRFNNRPEIALLVIN